MPEETVDTADRFEVSRRAISHLEAERERLEGLLLRVPSLMGELDVESLIPGVAEAICELVGARFGLFIPAGGSPVVPTYVGLTRGDFAELPALDQASVLAGAVGEPHTLRIEDVTRWALSQETTRAYGVLADGRLVRSWLATPVRGRSGVLLGILCLGHHRAHAFSAHDEELVEGLCAQLGVAIEKAGLFNERCRTATALQQALLPATLPRIPGVDLAARYRATGVGNLVGGDFYDIFEVAEETWGVILGDVCGCGPEAAALTGLARHTVRAVAAHANGPGSVLGQLNDAMLGQRSIDRFLTAIFCLVTPRPNGVELLLARGGHPCPLVLRDDGSVETPDQNEGLLVGAFPGVVFEDTRIILGPGDALVLVTDGALEARDPEGAEFGTERLESLLASCAGRSAGGIAQRVDRAVLDHQGGRGVDDLAIVVLRARPTTT